MSSMPKKNLLDDKDRKIIKMLKEDCLTPFVKIADTIGVNEGTVRHRVKRLLKNGIIKRFTITTDPEKLGLNTLAFVFVSIKEMNIRDIVKRLARIPNILEIHEIHTHGDLLLKIRVSDPKEIADMISNNIKVLDGINDTQVIYVLNTWKEEAY
ncbi:MAG: Lrp/AsnC family transcriptional regulator [Candidatus Nitrosothermus koennekii]|nr:MAG: Lrp/AsnC family transcriptional regulator [Candidatus Nitrosothermus koennekii]